MKKKTQLDLEHKIPNIQKDMSLKGEEVNNF